MTSAAKSQVNVVEVERVEKKKTPTIALDKSNVPRTFWHYLAMFIWVGWTSFYFIFMLALPFLWFYAKGVLTAIIALGVISAMTPIARHKQPKVHTFPVLLQNSNYSKYLMRY